MKTLKILVLFFIVVLLLNSCKDFIEPSISNKKIILLGPVDNLKTNIYAQSFWWEPVDDALTYRLQVVTQTFDSVGKLVIDTLVSKNKFNASLNPGKYEWRVKAENGSSETLFSKRSFTVYESSLSNQQVQLKSPSANFLTNQSKISLAWENLFSATKYHLQVDTLNNFADSIKLFYNSRLATDRFDFANLKEGDYKWRVLAENSKEKSVWSTVNNFTVDMSPPVKVVLVSPANKTVFSTKPVQLKWNASATAKQYEVAIMKSDSTQFNPSFPLTTTQTIYDFNGGVSGEKILWKIRAKDEAGNWSAFSEIRNFSIQ